MLLSFLLLSVAVTPSGAQRVCNPKTHRNDVWKRACLDEDAQHALEHPSRMTVMSLDPTGHSANLFARIGESLAYRHFHHFRLLGQATVTDSATRKRVAASVESAVRDFNGLRAFCFNPRHVVRVTSGSQTYDFVICYECSSFQYFSGERELGSISISGSSRTLDAILTAAHVPIAKD